MSLAGPTPRPAGDGASGRGTGGGQRPRRRRQRLAAVGIPPDIETEAPRAAETAHGPVPEPADPTWLPDVQRDANDLEVHILEELRPVPPPAGIVPRAAPPPEAPPPETLRRWVDDLPVYDPFSARRRRAPEWLVAHTATLVACDVLAAGAAVLCALTVRLTGSEPGHVLTVAAILLWPVLLGALGTYAEHRQGIGSVEYRRVVEAALISLAGLGICAALLPGEGFGRLLLVGTPIAAVLTLAGRALNRRRLHRARRQGLKTERVVVVGPETAALDLVHRTRRDQTAGLRVVGVCVPGPAASGRLLEEGIPILGTLEEVTAVLDQVRADAVLVATSTETSGNYLRDLAWRLEGTNIELLVGPGVVEVAANRLDVRPTTSAPLIRIQEPVFRGPRRLVKEVVDRLAAALLLLLCAPVFLMIACAVRLTSPGPVLYAHRRIGKCGREFDLLKFRSMVPHADRDVEDLMVLNEGNEVQFKLRRDPRVTPVGAFLRRYSLDELPQLINVLKGDMSLVGPRPHVIREVAQYGPDMQRRLLVKPGITGLWQVSGRSDLTWDDAVELDVRYVENWSIGLDLSILWRTVRAVIRGSGAY